MILEYGFSKIGYKDEEYLISPTLGNISNIHNIKELVNVLISKYQQHYHIYKAAFEVVSRCSNKKLHDDLYPHEIKFTPINTGKGYSTEHFIDADVQIVIINIALNCIKHGVYGVPSEATENSEGGELKEFKAIDYIDSAVAVLNLSYQDACNITMTQFIRQCELRDPDRENKKIEAQVKGSYFDYLANRKD